MGLQRLSSGSKHLLPLAELADLRMDRLTLDSWDPGPPAFFWVPNPLG